VQAAPLDLPGPGRGGGAILMYIYDPWDVIHKLLYTFPLVSRYCSQICVLPYVTILLGTD
jgi:hypothetical protein